MNTTPACVDEKAAEALAVRSCLSALRLSRIDDRHVLTALAHLELWLAENDPRWSR